jgi:hypothetical protein
MKLLDYRQAGPGSFKGLEKQSHRALDLRIRIEDGPILSVAHKADGNHLLELASPGTAQNATSQSRLEHMQFRLAHCALQAQEEAIVEVRRII